MIQPFATKAFFITQQENETLGHKEAVGLGKVTLDLATVHSYYEVIDDGETHREILGKTKVITDLQDYYINLRYDSFDSHMRTFIRQRKEKEDQFHKIMPQSN